MRYVRPIEEEEAEQPKKIIYVVDDELNVWNMTGARMYDVQVVEKEKPSSYDTFDKYWSTY